MLLESYHTVKCPVNAALLFQEPEYISQEAAWNHLDPTHQSLAYRLEHLFDWESIREQTEQAVTQGRCLAKLKLAQNQARQSDDDSEPELDALPAADESTGVLSDYARTSNRGRPSFDCVMMLKLLVYGSAQRLSEHQLAMAARTDRLVQLLCRIPPQMVISRSSIHQYSEYFTMTKFAQQLFHIQLDQLKATGVIEEAADIAVDSSFVEAEKRHVSASEEEQLKQNQGKDLWLDQPHRKCQIDHEATWTQKGNKSFFGFKMHTVAELGQKFVLDLFVSTASMHDSQAVPKLIDEKYAGCQFYADAAYVGPTVGNVLKQFGLDPHICEKGYRNRPLTESQKESNLQKSRKRSRIEHIFGAIQMIFKGSFVRTIGMARAESFCWFSAATYNILRLGQVLAKKT